MCKILCDIDFCGEINKFLNTCRNRILNCSRESNFSSSVYSHGSFSQISYVRLCKNGYKHVSFVFRPQTSQQRSPPVLSVAPPPPPASALPAVTRSELISRAPDGLPLVPPRQGISNPAFTLSEGAPSPGRSSMVNRSVPLPMEASVGPEVPPRETASSDSYAPPRPPKSTPAPPIPTRATPQPVPAASSQAAEPSLDENIARLMELGYSYDDVNRALTIAQNNSSVAVQILQSFVPACT